MPTELRKRYLQALEDQDNLHSLNDEIATLEAREGQLLEQLKCGSATKEAWDELRDVMDTKARLSKTEHRRWLDVSQVLPADKVALLFTAFLETVKTVAEDRIEDQHEARRLVSDVARRLYNMLPSSKVMIENPSVGVKESDRG
jgi:hypothetical protein